MYKKRNMKLPRGVIEGVSTFDQYDLRSMVGEILKETRHAAINVS